MTALLFRVRRCEILLFEPRETTRFDLACLLQGGNGLLRECSWVALAPHIGDVVKVNAPQRELLGRLSPSAWTEINGQTQAMEDLQALVAAGLVLQENPTDLRLRAHRDADERQRAAYWHPLAAVLHAFSRWDGVDAARNTRDSGADTAEGMRAVLGPPPALTADSAATSTCALPAPSHDAFDDLLARRATCRNFDGTRALPLVMFSTMLARVFGARARIKVGEDLVFEKKSSPSGGGLHPMEAYLIVQAVDGVEPGLYRYQSDGHCLVRLQAPAADLRDFAMEALGQQDWFADAHCLVTLVPRFDRTFWKYRRHEKGYRVVALEAGHLSQSLYLSATDLGLGAFITGAINERALEKALSLDPIRQGALAMCGFGWRANVMHTAELDPLGQVWSRAG